MPIARKKKTESATTILQTVYGILGDNKMERIGETWGSVYLNP